MPSPGSDGPTTVVEVVFAAEDTRVVLALDASLADEDGLTDELTDIAASAESRADLANEVQQVADLLGGRVKVGHEGGAEVLTLQEE